MMFRVILLAVLVSACAPQPTEPLAVSSSNLDGLHSVSSRYFDAAMVRSGVDFSHYQGILLRESELAFKTPDRSKQQFPLSSEQKDGFRTVLDSQFAEQLTNLENLRISNDVGPDVLAVRVRVQDILTTVPPQGVGQSGWGSLSLRALGEATLVIELSDSESGELLARVYDRSAVEGVAVAQKQAAPITRFQDVEAMCKRWAATVRERLDALVEAQY